ncbi:MAG: hypothetical protein DBX51_02080 [Clostridiales bacterium]|nr:MAG: hypothetical protein DBX51_02080 [Clostridiales bacterium]
MHSCITDAAVPFEGCGTEELFRSYMCRDLLWGCMRGESFWTACTAVSSGAACAGTLFRSYVCVDLLWGRMCGGSFRSCMRGEFFWTACTVILFEACGNFFWDCVRGGFFRGRMCRAPFRATVQRFLLRLRYGGSLAGLMARRIPFELRAR